jgi:hypothetical protein
MRQTTPILAATLSHAIAQINSMNIQTIWYPRNSPISGASRKLERESGFGEFGRTRLGLHFETSANLHDGFIIRRGLALY